MESGRATEIAVHPKKDRAKVAAGSERQVEVFTDAEVERILLHAADRGRCTARDGLVMAMLLYTGLRVSELVAVRLGGIDFFTLQLSVRGKGGKIREVPLKAEVIDAINEYLETERKESAHRGSDHLLLTQRAGRMDRDTVNKILRKHGRRLGIAMHPHKFRHTQAWGYKRGNFEIKVKAGEMKWPDYRVAVLSHGAMRAWVNVTPELVRAVENAAKSIKDSFRMLGIYAARGKTILVLQGDGEPYRFAELETGGEGVGYAFTRPKYLADTLKTLVKREGMLGMGPHPNSILGLARGIRLVVVIYKADPAFHEAAGFIQEEVA